MKGISRYILTMLVPFLCLSCTDEIPMPAGCGAAGGVDRGKTVRVSLPFSVSGGIRSDIVTRAAGTEDSRLGRIMLFMYENKGKDQSQIPVCATSVNDKNQPNIPNKNTCFIVIFTFITKTNHNQETLNFSYEYLPER